MFGGKILIDDISYRQISSNSCLEAGSSNMTIEETSYKSVFMGEVTTADFEKEPIAISTRMIKKELDEILKNNYSKVYTEMLKEEMLKPDNKFYSKETLIDFFCERDMSLYNKLKYLNLPFFVIGSRPVSLPKKKLNKIAHLDGIASKNMGVISENTYGSILQMKYWWIMTNDMLILSIIFNRIPAYIASPRCEETMYVLAKSRPSYSIVHMEKSSTSKRFKLNCLKKEYCITNFAREILGLLLAGYVIKDTGMGEILYPPIVYVELTLCNYVKAITYLEKEGISFITLPNLSGIKFDFENNCIKEIIFR